MLLFCLFVCLCLKLSIIKTIQRKKNIREKRGREIQIYYEKSGICLYPNGCPFSMHVYCAEKIQDTTYLSVHLMSD